MSEIGSPVLTIPGIGFKLRSVILAKIWDIKNFRLPNQLLAYAGAEPSVSTSGMNQMKQVEWSNEELHNYNRLYMKPPDSCLLDRRLCVSISIRN